MSTSPPTSLPPRPSTPHPRPPTPSLPLPPASSQLPPFPPNPPPSPSPPPAANFQSGQFQLHYWRENVHTCATYDLSLRKHPLKDSGLTSLIEALTGEYYLHKNKNGNNKVVNRRILRKLDLQGNELTSTGAAILARYKRWYNHTHPRLRP